MDDLDIEALLAGIDLTSEIDTLRRLCRYRDRLTVDADASELFY